MLATSVAGIGRKVGMQLNKMQLRRSERIEHIRTLIRTKKAVKLDSLVAELSIQCGYSERLTKEYVNSLINARYVKLENGNLETLEGASA